MGNDIRAIFHMGKAVACVVLGSITKWLFAFFNEANLL